MIMRHALALASALERFPIKWNHLIDKNSLKIKGLEHIPVSMKLGYALGATALAGYLLLRNSRLQAANEKLRDGDRLKDDFVASVTHELRTPLTSIRSLSELMLDTPDMDSSQRAAFLRIVVTESERLSRLVEQLLDIAAVESGEGTWRDSDIDMRALIDSAVAGMAGVIAERGIAVVTELPAIAPPIRANADRLTQVLVNLLSNAAKFVPQGTGRIVISVDVGGNHLAVRVRDNGPGVPPADRPHIFERFRQGGDIAARPPGTGLGLPISRRIVNHLGGEMWLEQVPGAGACFVFTLPLPQAAGGAARARTKP